MQARWAILSWKQGQKLTVQKVLSRVPQCASSGVAGGEHRSARLAVGFQLPNYQLTHLPNLL
jgi:hypothetical protein